MPITMTQQSPGMPAEAYDEIIANLAQPLRQSAGFISHTAQLTGQGVTVTEVWETSEHWQRWYDANVKPHLPEGAPDPMLVDIHYALGR